jgi:hypothetical protein
MHCRTFVVVLMQLENKAQAVHQNCLKKEHTSGCSAKPVLNSSWSRNPF